MPVDSLFPSDAVDFSFAKPSPNRPEPLFWICEIRFLHGFSNDTKNEIRRIEFKKGLNIIWAEPPANSSSLDTQRIAGHATGKTTLCRMIRFLLGENHFANDSVTASIRQKFPNGWAVAHIRVNGESWCVGRSFMTIHPDLAERTNNIDNFLIEKKEIRPYQHFKMAVASLLPHITSLQALPNKNELTFWHLLPWFTRDQDSQYTKLTEWRDNTLSNSASPQLTLKHTMLVMRSIIESDVTQEMELSSQQAELQVQLQNAKKELDTIESIIDYDTSRIREIGNNDDADTELNDMFLASIKERYTKLLSSICVNEDDEKTMHKLNQKRDEIFGEYQSNATQYNESLQAYRQACRELHECEKITNQTESKFDDLDEIQLAAQRRPDRKYCCVPLKVAIAENCKMAKKFTQQIDLESHENLSSNYNHNFELTQKRNAIHIYVNILKEEKSHLDVLQQELSSAEKVLADFLSLTNKKRNQRASDIGNVLEAVGRFERDKTQRDTLQKLLDELGKKHKKCLDDLAGLREKAKRSSLDIRSIYNDIIRYILGLEIKGDISFSGGDIELYCSYQDSKLSSAALNAVKNVCFDLTAMALSIGGAGSHPRFLIHDGPRVSDLAATIFRYYFSLAKEFEDVANNNANFQYIITTTEPPPKELQTKPWLICKLDAAHQDARLFRCNLG